MTGILMTLALLGADTVQVADTVARDTVRTEQTTKDQRPGLEAKDALIAMGCLAAGAVIIIILDAQKNNKEGDHGTGY